jgi:hypothetical protein
MVKYFKDNPNRPDRALQVWQILIGKARNRQTMTYGMLAEMLDYGGAGVFAQILGHIMFYCQDVGLPPLTVLVVNEHTGLPGEGLTGADLNADREAVFDYDWYAIWPPTPDDLSEASSRHQ